MIGINIIGAMKRRDVLQNAAVGAGLAVAPSVASASSNEPDGLEATMLDGRKELETLRSAWRDVQDLRSKLERRYEVAFTFSDGGAKQIESHSSGNVLTMAAFQGDFTARSHGSDSRQALLIWTAENGEPNEPQAVMEGMATDFDDLSADALEDSEFQQTVSDLNVDREEAMASHVSVLRTHDPEGTTTTLNVHSNVHDHGLLTEQAMAAAGEAVSAEADASSADIVYSSRISSSVDGVSTMGHGGGGLADCIKDSPVGAPGAACLATCYTAGSIITAAACAACGCWAGCWAGSCSKHVGDDYCSVTNFSCGLTIIFPPNAGSCCVAFGCHFDCGWLG